MIISRLAHVSLNVPDLDAAVAFYSDVFGFAVTAEGQGSAWLSCGRTETYEILLHESETRMDHFAFAVCGEPALEEARQRLAAAGAPVRDLDMSGEPGLGTGIATCLPDGHVVELVVESAPTAYGLASAAPLHNHRGVGPVLLEHITLLSDDIRSSVGFAVEQLGFRITDSVQPEGAPWGNTHLRAGVLHHDLAMLTGSGRGLPELHHVCFAVPSVADLVRLADILASRGMRLDASIGRHTAGNNVFIYFKDPSGHRLELNTDMARVDAAAAPNIFRQGVAFDAWRPGRPPALAGGTAALDGRLQSEQAEPS